MRTELKTDPNLARMVERLKDFGGISRVILFGSRARGEHEELSDYDLLIIVPDEEYRQGLDIEIRRLLTDISVAKDLIVTRQSTMDRLGDIAGTIYFEAKLEGVTVYAG
ncbi:nucleotidyltransferase domain-containing protein [bacterium]|nr:nucleotidyltransferase domain-containing protein [bacterium]